MNITDSLKADGWKPSASTDGEFKPLAGTYACEIMVLRPEVDKKNGDAKYYQLEVKPKELIAGDEFGEKFTFRKRFYVDGEKAAENLKEMLNLLFTAGIELDTTSDEVMEADFGSAIDKPIYVRSWGWTPTPKDGQEPRALQMWVAQKAGVAEKKRSTASHAF